MKVLVVRGDGSTIPSSANSLFDAALAAAEVRGQDILFSDLLYIPSMHGQQVGEAQRFVNEDAPTCSMTVVPYGQALFGVSGRGELTHLQKLYVSILQHRSNAEQQPAPRAQIPIKPSIGKQDRGDGIEYIPMRGGLTRRELDVAKLVAQGKSNRKISHELDLQEQSVKNLVSSVMRKLECENRVQVALKLTGQSSVADE